MIVTHRGPTPNAGTFHQAGAVMAGMPVDYSAAYREMGDDELLALVADGRSSFQADAWTAIENELAARRLTVAEQTSSPTVSIADVRKEDTRAGMGGWLVIFTLWALLYLLGGLALLVYMAGSAGVSLFWAVYGSAAVTMVPRGLFLMWRRDTRSRTFWLRVLAGLTLLHGGLFMLSVFNGSVTAWTAIAFAQVPAWWAYWARSRRVEEIFAERIASANGGGSDCVANATETSAF